MDEKISAVREARQSYIEAVNNAIADEKVDLKMAMENVKQKRVRLFLEEEKALKFLRMNTELIEEQQVALQKDIACFFEEHQLGQEVA